MNSLLDLFFDTSFYSADGCITKSHPYRIVLDKEGLKTTIIHYALGVKKDAINVKITDSYNDTSDLVIEGESENTILEETFKINSHFQVHTSRIKKVDWEAQDGIVTVDVFWKKPEVSKIPINKTK